MIIADSSAMIALFLPRDASHRRVREFVRDNRAPIVLPTPAVTEVSYFLTRRAGATEEAEFLRGIGRGSVHLTEPELADYLRAADLVDQYANFPLGTVDALIVAMAERLKVTTVLTLDRRHFGAIRPAHCESFTLVPEGVT